TSLTSSQPSSFNADIYLESGSLPIPGSGTIRATIENASAPLPAEPTCASSPSDTHCVQKTVQHRQSEINFAAETWTRRNATAPFEAGTDSWFEVGFQNVGFGTTHGPVTLQFLLPP